MAEQKESKRTRAITGCILGTAVGDAIGLPMEGLSRDRLRKLFPEPYLHRFLLRHGMVSDDTEHTLMVAQALIESAGEPKLFARSFARRLKRWILMLPGGTGMATAKSCLRLLAGLSPDKSGVFSAGNGPAMRSALIGVCYGDEPEKMRELVRISTRITHTDSKAEYGALAVALAAYLASSVHQVSPQSYCERLADMLPDEGEELLELVRRAADSVAEGKTTESFAGESGWGKGVKGYVYSTVPVALHAWLRNQGDFRAAVTDVIRCGGDTDTTAAIAGAIAGAGVGKEGIPRDWLEGLTDWPRSVRWMERLGFQLTGVVSAGKAQRPLEVPVPALLLRNILFLLVVIFHGFRRLLPPY